MNKAQLIAQMTGNVVAVLNEGVQKPGLSGGPVVGFEAEVLVTVSADPNIVRKKTQAYYVKDYTGPNEEAYFSGDEVKNWTEPPAPSLLPRDQVILYLQGRVDDVNDNLTAYEGTEYTQTLGPGSESPVVKLTYTNPGPNDYPFASIVLHPITKAPMHLPFDLDPLGV